MNLGKRLDYIEEKIHQIICYLKKNPSGGGDQNLQQVTDNGSYTTNPITTTQSVNSNNIRIESDPGFGSGTIYSNLGSAGDFVYYLPSLGGTIATEEQITLQNAYDNGNSITTLINATGDPTFTKVLVAKPDGTIGWDNINKSLEFLPSNTLGGSSGGFGSASIFRKGNVYTVHVSDFYIPPTVPKQSGYYIGDLTTEMQSPFGVMFPCLIRLSDGVGGNTSYTSFGTFEGTGLYIQMPNQVLVPPGSSQAIYISFKFQVVPTNVN